MLYSTPSERDLEMGNDSNSSNLTTYLISSPPLRTAGLTSHARSCTAPSSNQLFQFTINQTINQSTCARCAAGDSLPPTGQCYSDTNSVPPTGQCCSDTKDLAAVHWLASTKRGELPGSKWGVLSLPFRRWLHQWKVERIDRRPCREPPGVQIKIRIYGRKSRDGSGWPRRRGCIAGSTGRCRCQAHGRTNPAQRTRKRGAKTSGNTA